MQWHRSRQSNRPASLHEHPPWWRVVSCVDADCEYSKGSGLKNLKDWKTHCKKHYCACRSWKTKKLLSTVTWRNWNFWEHRTFGNIEPLGTSKLLGIKTGNRTEKFFGRLTTYDACLLIQLHERDFMSWKRFADYHKTAKYLADYRFDHLQRREIPYPELILLLVFQYGYILWLNWQSPKTGDSNLYCASQLYTADASMRYVCKIVNSAITVWYIM